MPASPEPEGRREPAIEDLHRARVVPKSEANVAEVVRESGGQRRLVPQGLGTRGLITLPEQAAANGPPHVLLDLTDVSGVVDLDVEEMVATFLAGTPLKTLAATLREHGLFLPPLLPEAYLRPTREITGGTIGGLYSDPRELETTTSLGRVRDHVLGINGVRGDGTTFRSGGRVVKNVTGYDLTRFLCGARGRWGVATKLHWRLQRIPEEIASAAFRFAQPDRAWEALDRVRASGLEPLSVSLLPESGTVQIVEAGREGVASERLARHRAALHDGGGSEIEIAASPDAGDRDNTSPAGKISLRIRAAYSAWPNVIDHLGATPWSDTLSWTTTFPFANFGHMQLHATAPDQLPDKLTALRRSLREFGATVSVDFVSPQLRGLPPDLLFGTADSLPEATHRGPLPSVRERLQSVWDPTGTLLYDSLGNQNHEGRDGSQ